MIKFLLNQELREEHSLDPNMTVLNYLREQVAKTGTKEGCASGDCGACTVVLGELDGDSIRYKSINACLTFVSALDGKQLITVEDLKHQGKLHKSQQAMVDKHGSQCGFCTPGIVMSLFALGKNNASPDKDEVLEALAGNLCRCTGYRPILDAAFAMYEDTADDQFTLREAATVERLKKLQSEQISELQHGNHQCHNPRTSDELAALLLQHPDARLLAGGTDLALEVTQFHRELDRLIYVGDIKEMAQAEVFEDRIELGAAAPLSKCYSALSKDYPDFGNLLHRFASLQIRNQGTLGGNIGNASPIGDAPPALIALNAQIVLRKGDQRRAMPLEQFFVDYKVTLLEESEFIEKVVVPRAPAADQFRAYKISKRLDDDISAVLGALNISVENDVVTDACIAFGGMAAIPKRASHCEKVLIGSAWNQATINKAMEALEQDFAPISDFRASREYRMLTARNLLQRYFIESQIVEVETRVTAYV
ncbi:xanthine dehydrogenase small subunit [Marinobacterium jannaschii]|uniref:xanthine dehydrogenase small subunit n=1 Tax=Marinobacterium jannaschii TaxID=64970 RepID=UPI000481611B|nr:xanthine dehydrogenase small subunit [Marinobacterium jannaschii]